MQINERIKEVRNEKQITQVEIAETLKVKQQQYYRKEKGLFPFKDTEIKIICEYLNISADYILGLTDEKRPLK